MGITASTDIGTATVATATAPFSLVRASFNGRNGSGSISLPGLKAGDLVFWMLLNGIAGSFAGDFEPIISVDDEIQQLQAANFSSQSVDILVLRGL
jgi:hypothetical protein